MQDDDQDVELEVNEAGGNTAELDFAAAGGLSAPEGDYDDADDAEGDYEAEGDEDDDLGAAVDELQEDLGDEDEEEEDVDDADAL